MNRASKVRSWAARIATLNALALGMQVCALAPGGNNAATQSGPEAAKPAAMDAILAALDANIASYDHSVPSFLCNEHVVSLLQPTYGVAGYQRTITDSVFRIRRTTTADDHTSLQESRLVKAVDGRPIAKSTTTDASEDTTMLGGPMSVFGIFSGGLSLVSTPAKICFRYHLHPQRKNHPGDKIVIEFENLPLKERAAPCPFGDQTSGRATINPATMRVVRLEAKLREYELRPGEKETWEWKIDYSPVVLSGMTFWMPSVIRSTAVPNVVAEAPGATNTSGRRGGLGATMSTQPASQSPPFTYSLIANYSDYHLLNVTSRIIEVTGDEDTSAPENSHLPQP
jgi:hypothetical protein